VDASNSETRLSGLQTLWSQVRLAHDDDSAARQAAREALLRRYAGAVRRYLIAVVRDREAADDLAQEFALRFLRGDFRRADPGSGRFRDYLKAALVHLVADHHRERRALPVPLPADVGEWAVAPDGGAENEADFLRSWREELIDRAWASLAEAKPTHHAVLILHVENPELPSAGVAERLTDRLGRPFTAAHVRVTLQRAREKFAALLLDEVALSLGACTEADLVQELHAVRLHRLCAPALARRTGRSTG
jgi:RNA polymerase sigma factor (sigma-70 family)